MQTTTVSLTWNELNVLAANIELAIVAAETQGPASFDVTRAEFAAQVEGALALVAKLRAAQASL